jgi:hypothetical protein
VHGVTSRSVGDTEPGTKSTSAGDSGRRGWRWSPNGATTAPEARSTALAKMVARAGPNRTTLVVTVTHPAEVEHGEVTSQLSREDGTAVDGAEPSALREEPFAHLQKYARSYSSSRTDSTRWPATVTDPAERSQTV